MRGRKIWDVSAEQECPVGCVRADGLVEPDMRQVLEEDRKHEINVMPSSQS
jgi:hypothetical protein